MGIYFSCACFLDAVCDYHKMNVLLLFIINGVSYNPIMIGCRKLRGGPRGRVVKVADFSALDHSIISPMWVRASHGARIHM